ncbi:hypothetical protein FISHEDRAFT_54919 [Fistulina hepatica ATCC 64428]|uniref:Uncharacterized protein n=1 Tax=Fistulina hepatica ATCC 64428 TaxID=1128425 RepID=A0A0D7AQL0_9AGAR|nr:hypothetical protein FISHEDRAFT_54919 [Fistulina hepatica ATCC 64428]
MPPPPRTVCTLSPSDNRTMIALTATSTSSVDALASPEVADPAVIVASTLTDARDATLATGEVDVATIVSARYVCTVADCTQRAEMVVDGVFGGGGAWNVQCVWADCARGRRRVTLVEAFQAGEARLRAIAADPTSVGRGAGLVGVCVRMEVVRVLWGQCRMRDAGGDARGWWWWRGLPRGSVGSPGTAVDVLAGRARVRARVVGGWGGGSVGHGRGGGMSETRRAWVVVAACGGACLVGALAPRGRPRMCWPAGLACVRASSLSSRSGFTAREGERARARGRRTSEGEGARADAIGAGRAAEMPRGADDAECDGRDRRERV